jgi:hypothetical protein
VHRSHVSRPEPTNLLVGFTKSSGSAEVGPHFSGSTEDKSGYVPTFPSSPLSQTVA